MRDDAVVTTVVPYAVVARNIDPHADNRIHDDDVAQRFGFTGALVPGVEVFAYATSPLVAAWGPATAAGLLTPLDLDRYPLAPLPDIAGQDPGLGPFGTVEVPGDRSAAEQYLRDVGEPLEVAHTALYRLGT